MVVFRGFFGKLPVRGDFVTAGLPRDFVSRWDAWISAALPAVLATSGDHWLETPAKRFRVAPGVYAVDGVTGVLFASIDKVGRMFPLTLAWSGDDVDMDAAERLGHAAIADAMPPAVLAERLAAVGAANDRQDVPAVLSDTITFAMIMTGGIS
jgi:type VI secretion system protein ImpM